MKRAYLCCPYIPLRFSPTLTGKRFFGAVVPWVGKNMGKFHICSFPKAIVKQKLVHG